MNDKPVIIINAIETNDGFFVSDMKDSWHSSTLGKLLFDGKLPTLTFHKDWLKIPAMPKRVSHMQTQPNINHRFVLIDDSLKSEKIPLEIKREDAGTQVDCQSFVWKDELAMYSSLYVLVSDPQPDIEVQDEFEWNVLFKVDVISEPPNFRYPLVAQYDRWAENNTTKPVITNQDIKHQTLDSIVFPSIALHERPCKLTSKQSYDIIREHVKTHINLNVARITSDYDFCFEVSKLVTLAKPYTTQHEKATPRKRKRPEFVTTYHNNKPVVCFEMTHTEQKHGKYTPMRGFEAENEQALKELIDTYLDDLMAMINEPLTECPTCNGTGVLSK